MQIITQINYKETVINFMIQKNFVGYSFEVDGKSYGQKSELKTKKKDEIVAITAALTINAISSYDALKNGKNINE